MKAFLRCCTKRDHEPCCWVLLFRQGVSSLCHTATAALTSTTLVERPALLHGWIYPPFYGSCDCTDAAAAARPRAGLFCILPPSLPLFSFGVHEKKEQSSSGSSGSSGDNPLCSARQHHRSCCCFCDVPSEIPRSCADVSSRGYTTNLKRNNSVTPASGSAYLACALFPLSSSVRYRFLLWTHKANDRSRRRGLHFFRLLRFFFFSHFSFLRALSVHDTEVV